MGLLALDRIKSQAPMNSIDQIKIERFGSCFGLRPGGRICRSGRLLSDLGIGGPDSSRICRRRHCASAALDKAQFKDWPKTVGELLVGRMTPAAALAAAKDADQICEAHYYSGMVKLKAKDSAAAQKEFTSARDGCPKSFREYHAAIADLKRLQSH
ncbi:hypothetical protein [Bradyrhizobium sp.]|uniref:hypothetical protein n=1 Tax=Bradyrhizobium sp. TaxID=376 RepID=UPI001EC5EC71|nr:hypothetical protein [Bradyrhizobium sp.]MBV9984583.1 hypothetical protein [Bradyrhizobium sp.]